VTAPPVVVFAYARPDTLRRTLECLRENQIPQLYVFCDGAKSDAVTRQVKEVRALVREITWTKLEIIERGVNFGLGKSIRAGVDEILGKHDSLLVFEDDLICVPGTYQYLAAALEQYRDNDKVMSVTGWTHRRVTPSDVGELPYFDGRAESLLWGTWKRAWKGMDRDAASLVAECRQRGIDPTRFGTDVLDMAAAEQKRNIWAVRWVCLHLLNRGLCMRPPRSMVDHIGLDHRASNAGGDAMWEQTLGPAPAIPTTWPAAVENPQCSALWKQIGGGAERGRLRWIAQRLVQRITARGRELVVKVRR
jgi:hypothetical protein